MASQKNAREEQNRVDITQPLAQPTARVHHRTGASTPKKSGTTRRDKTSSLGTAQLRGQPVQALKQTLAVGRAAGHDVPRALAEGGEAQGVDNLRGLARTGQVLLVSEHQQHRVTELFLRKHLVQLLAGLLQTLLVLAVYHEDNALRVLEIVAPQRPDLDEETTQRREQGDRSSMPTEEPSTTTKETTVSLHPGSIPHARQTQRDLHFRHSRAQNLDHHATAQT